MNNKSYIGISFIVLIFGIWAVPKIVAKFQKSDLVEKMVAASFLNETIKRNYVQAYQGRLKQLMKV